MALRSSTTVTAGDTATATQYNNSLRDAIYLAGDHATSGGSANVQTLSLSAQVTTYETGMKIRFIPGFTNTDSMTINVNGIGAVTVKDENGASLIGGEVIAGTEIEMTYNGTNFIFRRLEITGIIKMWVGRAAPTGYLLCDGSAVSRTTYPGLFSVLNPVLGTFTVTIASPGVVTLSSHGLATGDSVYLTTTGALPTGLSTNTRYWVIKNGANSFWLATSLANALAGTKINTSGSQSGTHTARSTFGVGDGSTTFNLPAMKGAVPIMLDQSQTEFAGLAQTGGEKTHVLTVAEMPSHTHSITTYDSPGSGNTANSQAAGAHVTDHNTSSAGSDGAHNNLQPYFVLNFIIKT